MRPGVGGGYCVCFRVAGWGWGVLRCGEWGWRSAGESRGEEGMRFRLFPWLWGFGVFWGMRSGFHGRSLFDVVNGSGNHQYLSELSGRNGFPPSLFSLLGWVPTFWFFGSTVHWIVSGSHLLSRLGSRSSSALNAGLGDHGCMYVSNLRTGCTSDWQAEHFKGTKQQGVPLSAIRSQGASCRYLPPPMQRLSASRGAGFSGFTF